MGNIKINYEKVSEISVKYKEKSEQIANIKNEMKDIYEKLNEIWKGRENNNFNQKFLYQIEKINSLIVFLETSSKFLNDISNKHSSSEEQLKNNMVKVSNLYEY